MSVRATRSAPPAIVGDLALVIAVATDRALAAQLHDADVRGHVVRAALAVQGGRVLFAELPDPLLVDVAEVLEWAEGAPPSIVRDAVAYAHTVVAARAVPPLRFVGALARWRRELAAGARQFGDTDALATAARWETVALERDAAGDRAGALDALDRAGECVLTMPLHPAPAALNLPAVSCAA